MTSPGAAPRALVLYDGLCGLCDATVQWLLRHDKKNVLTAKQVAKKRRLIRHVKRGK